MSDDDTFLYILLVILGVVLGGFIATVALERDSHKAAIYSSLLSGENVMVVEGNCTHVKNKKGLVLDSVCK
jgi:hypothetical protein